MKQLLPLILCFCTGKNFVKGTFYGIVPPSPARMERYANRRLA